MSEVVLTEAFLAEIAGWEAMKQARGLLATGRVLSSDWTPPILKGVVQDGPVSYRAILVLKSENDVENHCSCRAARDWGTICAHSVAVGLHQLKGDAATALAPQPATKAAAPARSSGPRLQRAGSGGEPAELFVILPPNLEQALARGQVMLCFEAAWRGGRTPLNALPRSQPFCFPAQDGAVLDQVEYLAGGETPAMLMIENRDFAALLPALVEHPRLTLGRSTPLKVEPRSPRFLLELKGGLARLSALLQCAYGPRILTPGVTARDDSLWLPDPDSPTRYFTRDLAAEQSALDGLRRAGFAGPDAQGRLQLLGQNQVLNFFAREFSRLQREWEVTLEERLERSTTENLERIEPRFQITSSGVQWFDLAVSFDSGSGEKLSPADIQRLLLSGQSHQRLRNGRIALIDTGAVEELQEVLLDCSPQQHAQGYRLSSTQAGFLEATLRQHSGWQVQAPAAWRERARQQNGEAMMEGPPLGELEGVLRPYQKAGVAWLYFLRQNGFGGILADEMGLGKTLQTLALLDSKRRSEIGDRRSEIEMSREARPISVPSPNSDLRSPNLVVCPTSLVFNWVAEATKFTPALRVLALHGPDRSAAFERIRQSDLVITSYALIRRDAGRYSGLEFDTLVLDEAQHIKNRQTQNAQAVKAIRARHRLVLTGTPLENSVLDLWSIFDFLMPGYLGAAQDFRERYEGPITRDRNSGAQSRLARRLRPFLLRRLKRDVARDLPARLEQVSFCELTDDQRAVYQQVMEASRKEVMEAVGAQGLARSRMVVLNALLRLRQICCDLRLLKLKRNEVGTMAASVPPHPGPISIELGDAANANLLPLPARNERGEGRGEGNSIENGPPLPSPLLPRREEREKNSGKLELFSELLEEILDGGHRVLVFSQFVSMLTLLREQLTAEGVEFCYLDGSTTNRGEVVERFQTNHAIPVFLISLKAGGVGLNLTGADTVIHFDPWWNPAVEDQATDRAHRIGQTRVVTSYKLITRGTVEEKILTLQQRKRDVIQATLGGEEQLAEALTWEEIQELFA